MSFNQNAKRRPDSQLIPPRKRIIICCDGTWQSAVSGKENCPSNVTRLCRAINSIGTDPKDHKPWQQVVWYDSGVGTTSVGLGPSLEGAVGQGLEGNVIEAYNFCVLNWNPGDKIMCFGFSRGAYTARAIAGLISDIGICEKSQLNDFPTLWNLYKQVKLKAPGQRFYGSVLYYDWQEGKLADPQPPPEDRPNKDELVWEYRAHGQWAQTLESMEVEVVGVFDTVGALGMPEVMGMELPQWLSWTQKPEWHNVGLSPNILHAFQALALDEHRKAFTPTLYYVKDYQKFSDERVKEQRRLSDEAWQKWYDMVGHDDLDMKELRDIIEERNQTTRKLVEMEESQKMRKSLKDGRMVLQQVWFPGYHIHIGGGSSDTLKNKDNMEEMSSITFAWMLDQLKGHVSINEDTINSDWRNRQYNFQKLNEAYDFHAQKVKDEIQEQKKESWAKSISHFPFRTGKSAISAATQVYQGKPFQGHRRYGWGTGELQDSFTLAYTANGSKPRTPGRYAVDANGKLGETFEYIHPAVGFRVKHTEEDPDQLNYRPIGLQGDDYIRRKKKDGGGKYEYVFTYSDSPEPVILPEWPLGAADCYERLVIERTEAYDYVDQLDRELGNGIKTPRVELWNVHPGFTEMKTGEQGNAGFSHVGFQ